VSPEAYNRKTGLFLACPVTSRAKGYPFEVPLPECSGVTGVVLADQIKSLDWRTRGAEFASATDKATVNDVVSLVLPLIVDEG
jgi:mRNA interferase MazF